MATKRRFKYTQNPLIKSGVKLGAGVGTVFGMAFLDKQVPFLTKNQWITPTSTFILSLGGSALTPKDSFGRDMFDGINVVAGVDTALAFFDMARARQAQQSAAAVGEEPAVDGMGRTVRTRNGRARSGSRMGKSKNPTVPYQNFAR